MPWPTYTERFFMRANSTSWYGATVPTGRRWVFKSLLATGDATNTCGFYVRINGIYAVFFNVPASEGMRAFGLTLACYGGDLVELNMSRAGCCLTISGFSFATTGTELEEDALFEEVPAPPAEEWAPRLPDVVA